MRKKNLTPFLFGLKATSRKPPKPEVTVVVRGRFAVSKDGAITPHEDQGKLTADVYAEGDDERTGALVYASDFADTKLRGEVLLTGLCFAPGMKAVAESFVRLQVGDKVTIDRRVFGDRVIKRGIVASFGDPTPFVTMPLGFDRAFGGPGFADNPVGRGYASDLAPNVEWPTPMQSPSDRPKPASPGPVSPTFAPRTGKLGSRYGSAWAKERAPFYAEDFDWSSFQAAPEGQQVDGVFRGDEKFVLMHLHPECSSIETALPGLRVRAFLRDHAGTFSEVTLALDTVHLASDEQALYLTWRGVGPTREIDLTDLAFGIIASEPLAEPALPLSHYETMMAGFVDDPIGIRDTIPAEVRDIVDALRREPPPADPSARPALEADRGKARSRRSRKGEGAHRADSVDHGEGARRDRQGPRRSVADRPAATGRHRCAPRERRRWRAKARAKRLCGLPRRQTAPRPFGVAQGGSESQGRHESVPRRRARKGRATDRGLREDGGDRSGPSSARGARSVAPRSRAAARPGAGSRSPAATFRTSTCRSATSRGPSSSARTSLARTSPERTCAART